MQVIEKQLFSLFHIGNHIQQLNKKTEKQLGISLVQWFLLRNLIDIPASPSHFSIDYAALVLFIILMAINFKTKRGPLFYLGISAFVGLCLCYIHPC